MPERTRPDSDVLHAVFGDSAGGTLRQALRLASRKERIIVFCDDLSFGPIDPPDPIDRMAWAGREFAFPRDAALAKRVGTFWDTALAATGRRVVWVSRRSAHEYAGFLEWIWRLAAEPFEVVDLTDVEIAWISDKSAPVTSLGVVRPDLVRDHALWDHAAPLKAAAHKRYREMWRKLRAENAPFRVVAGDDLVSAPITVHDELLLSGATREWRKTARVVGEAIGVAWDRGVEVSDLVASGRIRALAAAGRLEAQGDLAKMRFSEVRLPRA